MADKRMIWSPRALEELKSILEFYNKRNGNTTYSSKILDSIEETLEIISKNNQIGRTTTDHQSRVVNLDIFFNILRSIFG